MSALDRVVAHLSSYDEAALIALSNRGLVRRAAKDLEKEAIAIESAGEVVKVRVGSEVVSLDETGPKHARCTCPARGVCRHLLSAILFLRAGPAEKHADPAALEAELLAIDLDALTKWAGKRILREAIGVLADEPEPQIEVGDAIVISFPESMVECRWFLGAGLPGAITTARGADREKYVVAAVIAFQRSRNREVALDDAPRVLAESAGAPRSRAEVIASAIVLFEEMIDAGLAHLTEPIEARLTTLSISAIGVNLPRLALDLKRVADEVSALVVRASQADELRLFGELARAYALSSALSLAKEAAPADLVGWHRTRYREIGTVELSGLGAYAWRTSSGYMGLTVVFREAKSGEWQSWSDSRPAQYADQTPEERYRSVGPWEGMRDPAQASRSRFQLFHARRNERRRLSASTKSKAQVIAPVEISELDLTGRSFADFALLAEHVESQRPAGLGVYDPLADLAIVRPARFGARSFDEIRQLLRYELHDAEGRTLPLVIMHGPDTEAVISLLEKIDPVAEGIWGLMGRVYVADGELRMRPFTLYTNDGIQNLGLDGITPSPIETPAAGSEASEREEEGEAKASIDSASVHRIRTFESVLEELAEIGRGALSERRRKELLGAARSLESAGFPILATAARAVLEASPVEAAGRILRGRYLAAVHRDLAR